MNMMKIEGGMTMSSVVGGPNGMDDSEVMFIFM